MVHQCCPGSSSWLDAKDKEVEPDEYIQIIKSSIARRFQGDNRVIAYTKYTRPNAVQSMQQGTIKS
jgi:hypothetical protein